MAITKEKKSVILKELEEKFSRAEAVYFAMNSGLSVKDLSALRKKLRQDGIDFVVAKKTLLKLAAKNIKSLDLSDQILSGPIGAAFGYQDIISPSKIIKEFDKDGIKISLTGGIIEGRLIEKAEALQMASLPSKQELLAKLLGSLKSPVSSFHGVLHGLLSKFVRTMDAVKTSKS